MLCLHRSWLDLMENRFRLETSATEVLVAIFSEVESVCRIVETIGRNKWLYFDNISEPVFYMSTVTSVSL